MVKRLRHNGFVIKPGSRPEFQQPNFRQEITPRTEEDYKEAALELQRKLVAVLRETRVYRALGEVYGFDFSPLQQDLSQVPQLVQRFNSDLLEFLSLAMRNEGMRDCTPQELLATCKTWLNRFPPIYLSRFQLPPDDDITPVVDCIQKTRSVLDAIKLNQIIATAKA